MFMTEYWNQNEHKVLVIAEIGVNHNGDMKLAKDLIDIAKESGADIAKFQSFQASNLVTSYAEKAEYQSKLLDSNESQYEMLKNLELSKENHKELLAYCNKVEIEFLSSPFDAKNLDDLLKLGIKRIKIPSGELTNPLLLTKAAKTNKKILLSTGMSTLEEVKTAFDLLINCGAQPQDLTILHCNTDYPSLYKDVNLKAMLTIKNKLGVSVGYSDHTLGIEIPIAAVALGASVIEKHLTLDVNMEGPDHPASLEADDFKQMVKSIRNIEQAIGDGIKVPSSSEKKIFLS